jgi:negative regulator of sigma E activity
MNDDELQMRAETASAYLDGELDASERTSAAADPDTMSLVDSFARVRALIGDVSPAGEATRSAAIAAALAEFDSRRSATPVVAAAAVAPVTSLHTRRMRAYRVLTGVAAAAAIVGVIAVAALNSTSEDSKSSSASENSAPSNAEPAESAQVPAFKVGATEAASADTVGVLAAAATAAAAGGSPAADSAATAIPAIDSRAALAQYAADLTRIASGLPAGTFAPQPAALPTTIAAAFSTPPCLTSNDVVLGAITVLGTPAFAIRDTSTGAVRAIDALDCRVFFTVDGP